MSAVQTIGFVGVGKIGMPISQNLIKSGYRVVGYRRSSLEEFEKIGGVPARSAAEVGAQADIVFSCLPSDEALEEVVQGPEGLVHSARPGQVVVELGSYPVPVKQRQVAPLAAKGAAFIDGEVAGTPGMVLARKGVIFLAGDADACKKVEPVVAAFADSCIYFGPFGAASRVKLINNLLVSIHIAATAEAMALGVKAGVDVDLLIKAIASGSGGSTQFGIRAPWMAERRFKPLQGPIPGLQHYFEMIGEFADGVGVATPLLDRTAELFDRFVAMGLSDCDGAAMIDVIGSLPREKSKGSAPKGQTRSEGESGMIRVHKIAHATYETPDLDQQAEYLHRHSGADARRQGKGHGVSRLDGRSSFRGVAARRQGELRRARFPDSAGRRSRRIREASRRAGHQDRAQEGPRAFGNGHRLPSPIRRARSWRCSSAMPSRTRNSRARASCRTSSATSPSTSPT